jgi:hypothetical protein
MTHTSPTLCPASGIAGGTSGHVTSVGPIKMLANGKQPMDVSGFSLVGKDLEEINIFFFCKMDYIVHNVNVV